MGKPCLLLTQCIRILEFAIEKKPLASFYGINATLPIGQIGREKEKTIII
jgi:hypothetical protein